NDPGADNVTSWSISWGDGTIQTSTGNPASAEHTYADGPNDYTVTATATDEDGTFAAGNSVAVHVSNVAPTLVLSGPGSVDEGSLYTLTLSTSDPGSDTVSGWSLN